MVAAIGVGIGGIPEMTVDGPAATVEVGPFMSCHNRVVVTWKAPKVVYVCVPAMFYVCTAAAVTAPLARRRAPHSPRSIRATSPDSLGPAPHVRAG
jgi:hypothetical protein